MRGDSFSLRVCGIGDGWGRGCGVGGGSGSGEEDVVGQGSGRGGRDREVGVPEVPVAHVQSCAGGHCEPALPPHDMPMRDWRGGGLASDVGGGLSNMVFG
jgi:hypothetical protein